MQSEEFMNLDKLQRTKPIDLGTLLDQTQGYLILRINSWNAPAWLKQIGLSSLYCIIAIVFLVIFAIESLVQDQLRYALVLLTFAGLTLLCFIHLCITRKTTFTNGFVVLLLGMLCLFLLYNGGVNGTGPLWFFVFPLFALFALRLWAGILSVLILFSITLLFLIYPPPGFDPSLYTQAFKERFLAVYVALSAMAFLYAYTRASSELELQDLNDSYRSMANTDMLTNLPNRRSMQMSLYQEFSRAQRGKQAFSLIVMDIDHFKRLNDTYGHECGDRVLQAVPMITGKVLRTQDICSRWGGEEFLILLPSSDKIGAMQVAERLRKAFEEQSFQHGSNILSVKASFGISEYQSTDDLDTCIRRADENLYKAKSQGRNQVVC